MKEGKKRLFILLGLSILVVYGAIFAFIWFLISNRSPLFNKILLISIVAAFVVIMLFMAGGLLLLVFSLWRF